MLVRNSGDVKNWKGFYLVYQKIPIEPWGDKYAVQNPGKVKALILFNIATLGFTSGRLRDLLQNDPEQAF